MGKTSLTATVSPDEAHVLRSTNAITSLPSCRTAAAEAAEASAAADLVASAWAQMSLPETAEQRGWAWWEGGALASHSTDPHVSCTTLGSVAQEAPETSTFIATKNAEFSFRRTG